MSCEAFCSIRIFVVWKNTGVLFSSNDTPSLLIFAMHFAVRYIRVRIPEITKSIQMDFVRKDIARKGWPGEASE